MKYLITIVSNRFKLFLFILLISLKTYPSDNTIIVIINEEVITQKQLEPIISSEESKSKKISLIKKIIFTKLILNDAKRLKIEPSDDLINYELQKIANIKNIKFSEFSRLPAYNKIITELKDKLTIVVYEKIVRDSLKINETYEDWLKELHQKSFVRIFENKL